VRAVITRISPEFPSRVALQWDLEAVSETGIFQFVVERSGSPGGPWTVIETDLDDTYLYTDPLTDEEANVLSLGRDIYYRVKATPPSGAGNAVYSVTVNLDGQAESTTNDPIVGIGYTIDDGAQVEVSPATGQSRRPTLAGRKRLLRRKIIRDETIALKKLNGIEFLLLKRRHFGTRCTAGCYDPASKEVTITNCATCYGTSWEDGYFTPVELLGRRLASQVQTNIGQQTKDDVDMTRIQVLDFPRIDEGDLLVEKLHNRRFLVKQRYFTTLKTVPVHQTLTVSELNRQAVEYNIPLSV
jgi:hypothetical protein